MVIKIVGQIICCLNRVISLSKPTLYEHKSINYSVGIVEQVGSYRKKSLEFIHKYV